MRWMRPERLVRVVIIAVATVVAVTCVRTQSERCPDGTVCREGTTCVPLAQFGVTACATPGQLDECDGLDDGTPCEATGPGTCYGGACHAEICGDGIPGQSEVCDDGNRRSDDGCSADCASTELCGDSIVDFAQGEQCDEGVPGLGGDGCSTRCTAEYRLWRDVLPSQPATRWLPGLASDPTGGVILFGGATLGSGSPLPQPGVISVGAFDDTWRWNGSEWLELEPIERPGPRARFAIATDLARDRTVLFGGIDGEGKLLDETWEWDGFTWRLMAPPDRPTARWGAGMACAPGRCVLFGGVSPGAGSAASETWIWDGTTWSQVTTTDAPTARVHPAMAYNDMREKILLFGGSLVGAGSGSSSNETWELDPTQITPTWTRETSPGLTPPGTSVIPIAAFDQVAGEVVLITGSQTWLHDGSWRDATPGSGIPPSVLASDRVREVVVGLTNNIIQPQTWTGTAWTPTLALTRVEGGRAEFAATYDARRGRTIVLSSGKDTGTFAWNGRGWHRITGSGPPSLLGAGLAYDVACDRAIAFGGRDATTWYGETWTFQGTTWSHDLGDGPPPRASHGMTYDSEREVVVVFGGSNAMVSKLSDVWELRGPCGARTWTDVTPASGPSARSGASFAFDEERGVAVLFGGLGVDGERLGDTWEWDGTSWTERSPAAAPSPREGHASAYDPMRRKLVIAFGNTASGSANDAWEWNEDAGTWDRITAVVSPVPRHGLALALDATGGLLGIGGADAGGAVKDLVRFSSEQVSDPPERCQAASFDTDGDGLEGCADPDCWLRCAPLCPPHTSCAEGPRCGDGDCSPVEDYLICPADCVPP